MLYRCFTNNVVIIIAYNIAYCQAKMIVCGCMFGGIDIFNDLCYNLILSNI